MAVQNNEKSYKEGRFEFALYVNNNIICKRNFSINDFIEHSMESIEFKEAVDGIVRMIDDDLKSKSRVYTWYYFNPMEPDAFEEFNNPPINAWECTFKFEVLDHKKVIISKIWDGYAYPKAIRDKVDIGNRTVKITSRNDRVYTYEKESFFKSNEGRLSFDQQVLRSMIIDKADLLAAITRKICEVCSTHDGTYDNIDDYTMFASYGKDADGNEVKYCLDINTYNRKIEREWARAAAEAAKKKQEEKEKKTETKD